MSQVLDPLPLKLSVKAAIYDTYHNNHSKGAQDLINLVDGSEPKVKKKFIERVKALRPDLFKGDEKEGNASDSDSSGSSEDTSERGKGGKRAKSQLGCRCLSM
eukprot:TRINITY_DN1295_c0_g3_i2.p1 TRINITY_DN1295_c0_g3~~TRINITY_DN1295_c0_g3_i2.p1  ORF type:complete len:103 (+),score=26.43 TRINITY_DN1295_c0_g3_i2:193-501(+)